MNKTIKKTKWYLYSNKYFSIMLPSKPSCNNKPPTTIMHNANNHNSTEFHKIATVVCMPIIDDWQYMATVVCTPIIHDCQYMATVVCIPIIDDCQYMATVVCIHILDDWQCCDEPQYDSFFPFPFQFVVSFYILTPKVL